MEDSTIKAEYVYFCNDNKIDENVSDIKNISQLSDYVNNYNLQI